MKYGVLLLAALGVAAALFMADRLYRSEIERGLPLYIHNPSQEGLPLYEAKPPYQTVAARLLPGRMIPYLYAGDQGAWWYGDYNGTEVVLKGGPRVKAMAVQGVAVPLPWLMWGLPSAVFLLVLLTMGVSDTRKRKARHRESLRTIEQQTAQIQRLAADNHRLQVQLSAQIIQQTQHDHDKQRLRQAFEQEEKRLRLRFEQEAQRREQVREADMQASLDSLQTDYLNLKAQYQRCLDEGLVFDVNFDGARYENLLKGRQFEIFFAKLLLSDGRFEILEWSSDKGFENGIYVAANGNPDFVVQFDGRLKFAVECKYRGGVFKFKNGVYDKTLTQKRMSWCNARQSIRYRTFGRTHSMPVFVALGFVGEATAPEHTYFVELEALIRASVREKVPKQDKSGMEIQLVVWKRALYDNYLPPNDGAGKVVSQLQGHFALNAGN